MRDFSKPALRLTPTNVGKTLGSNRRIRVPWDYPLPPRVWGIHIGSKSGLLSNRSTPTYVGITGLLHFCKGVSRDHPHIRGENHHLISGPFNLFGSPPHTWGKHSRKPDLTGFTKFGIPKVGQLPSPIHHKLSTTGSRSLNGNQGHQA